MDQSTVESLLKAIQSAVTHRPEHDVALPIFDPSTNDNGAATWCDNIEKLADVFNWSSLAQVAKAGKALRGSALLWFENWEPDEGRDWKNFRSEITALYPEKKNLTEKLQRAVNFSSDHADTYCDYAREKLRLLKATKVSFTETQLIELICGGIRDSNVKMASFNSSAKTVPDLIALFTSYAKTKKRSSDNISDGLSNENDSKRFKSSVPSKTNYQERRCYNCGTRGHLKSECRQKKISFPQQSTSTWQNHKICSFCKKPGHDDTTCFFKKKSQVVQNPLTELNKNNQI